MGFEVFDRSKAVYGRAPKVTAAPRGMISINQSAYRKMGNPAFVLLMFDAENGRIGIKGTSDEREGFKVRVATRPGSPAVLSASTFFNYYDITSTESRSWTPTFDNDVLIIDLKDAGRPASTPRARGDDDAVDEDAE